MSPLPGLVLGGPIDAALEAPLSTVLHASAALLFHRAALPSRRSSTAPHASTAVREFAAIREFVTFPSTSAYEFLTVAIDRQRAAVHVHPVRDLRCWRDRGRAALPGPRQIAQRFGL